MKRIGIDIAKVGSRCKPWAEAHVTLLWTGRRRRRYHPCMDGLPKPDSDAEKTRDISHDSSHHLPYIPEWPFFPKPSNLLLVSSPVPIWCCRFFRRRWSLTVCVRCHGITVAWSYDYSVCVCAMVEEYPLCLRGRILCICGAESPSRPCERDSSPRSVTWSMTDRYLERYLRSAGLCFHPGIGSERLWWCRGRWCFSLLVDMWFEDVV